MDPVTAARETANVIGPLPAGFMLDTETYVRGAELGFEGTDFYVAGRGGALGDVVGKVVAAAFVFFNPSMIVDAWDRGRKVMEPDQSAAAFGGCLRTWAEEHLPDGVDYGRLAHLSGMIIEASSPAGAPLFAAWSSQEEPEAPKALALHRLNVLRELRGALHGAAVLSAGLTPLQAVLVHTPFMAPIFGWPEPYPDVSALREDRQRAETATDVSISIGFAALTESERAEFSELAHVAKAGATTGTGLL